MPGRRWAEGYRKVDCIAVYRLLRPASLLNRHASLLNRGDSGVAYQIASRIHATKEYQGWDSSHRRECPVRLNVKHRRPLQQRCRGGCLLDRTQRLLQSAEVFFFQS